MKTFRTHLALCRTLMFSVVLMIPAATSYSQQPVPAEREKTVSSAEPAEAKESKDENEAYRHSATVQKLGHLMGISTDAAATTFEVLNFAVLLGLVGAFLLKALPKTFRGRTAAIQKDLVDARSATEAASLRLNSVEERLSKLDGQIAEMRAQAARETALDEARMKAAIEEETRKILAGADGEIAAATMLAQRQLQRYAAELAIDQAARSLVISAETDRLLVQRFAERIGVGASKGREN